MTLSELPQLDHTQMWMRIEYPLMDVVDEKLHYVDLYALKWAVYDVLICMNYEIE